MKILISVANYGTKNDPFLHQLLDEFRTWPCEKDIFVHTNIQKNVGDDVHVQVGLPTPDPRSLVYCHRKLFVDNIDNYDLFLYTEDDMLIKWQHVQSFIDLDSHLPPEKVPGFLRYEEGGPNTINMMDIHAIYHWRPESVEPRGPFLLADFTNKHAAMYLLTREHLRIAVDSGRYSLVPERSRYGVLESAASDVFEYCGLQKVICISHVDQFLIHHLPNKYINKLGVSKAELDNQIDALTEINAGRLTSKRLFPTKTKLLARTFDRTYYGDCDWQVVKEVGSRSSKILSIGCDSGATEAELMQQGHQVIAIPLDEVTAMTARKKGVQVLTPDFEKAMGELAGETFDHIIIRQVLEHLPQPDSLLTRITDLLKQKGTIIASFLNMQFIRLPAAARTFEPLDLQKNGSSRFEHLGIQIINLKVIRSWLSRSGLSLKRSRYPVVPGLRKYSWLSFGLRAPKLSKRLIVVAQK